MQKEPRGDTYEFLGIMLIGLHLVWLFLILDVHSDNTSADKHRSLEPLSAQIVTF